MGNFFSCTPMAGRPAATVADLDGNIRVFATPATAAELMLEAPGHLISRAKEVRRTRRFLAMKADEGLENREVYLLFPLEKLGSKVPARQMAVVNGVLLDGKGRRRREESRRDRRRAGRVWPEVAGEGKEEEEVTGGNSNCGGGGAVVGFGDGAVMGFPMRRRTDCNSLWIPVLEPILESS